jgi:XTP/dITP diphosphohydrolase
MKLLIASNNKHKLEEIKNIFDLEFDIDVSLVTPNDVLNEDFDIEENGKTLEENAFLKAHAFYTKTGIPTIADDTGLEIDALGGEPGIYSARFAGEHGNDAMNRKKALDLLLNTSQENRTARFRTVICYFNGSKTEYINGICDGIIIDQERGTSGFGYDPIFIPYGFKLTFAEMSQQDKNKISHRGKAIRCLAEFLKTL